MALIDGDLVLAGSAALFQRRKIHERKEDRALHLVGVGVGEKNHGPVRIDALNLSAERMGRGIGEKREDFALILGQGPWQRSDGAAGPQRRTARRKKGGAKIAPPFYIRIYSAAASLCVAFLASSAR